MSIMILLAVIVLVPSTWCGLWKSVKKILGLNKKKDDDDPPAPTPSPSQSSLPTTTISLQVTSSTVSTSLLTTTVPPTAGTSTTDRRSLLTTPTVSGTPAGAAHREPEVIHSQQLPVTAITGLCVGGVVLITAFVIVAVLASIHIRKKRANQTSADNTQTSADNTQTYYSQVDDSAVLSVNPTNRYYSQIVDPPPPLPPPRKKISYQQYSIQLPITQAPQAPQAPSSSCQNSDTSSYADSRDAADEALPTSQGGRVIEGLKESPYLKTLAGGLYVYTPESVNMNADSS